MMENFVEKEKESAGVSKESRRDFLAKAGAFAVYTPPTMLALMLPSAEAVASGGVNSNPKDKKGKKGEVRRKIQKIKYRKRRQMTRRQMKRRRG